jgi:hypothetical protein
MSNSFSDTILITAENDPFFKNLIACEPELFKSTGNFRALHEQVP